jgi:hypothetical protein
VDLLGGRGHRLDPTPGRVFIVGPGQTFEQFADAIDSAFARWDRSHLHEFELADGRKMGYPDDEYAPDLVWLDHATFKVTREVKQATSSPTCLTSATTGSTAVWWPRARPIQSTSTGSFRRGRLRSRGGDGFPIKYGRRAEHGDDEDSEEW